MRIDLRLCVLALTLLLTVGLCQARVMTQGTHEVLGSFGWDKVSVSDEAGYGVHSYVGLRCNLTDRLHADLRARAR
jgi:hypothetical protein